MSVTENSVIPLNAAKQKELNRAVVYNTVIHDKLPLSRFDSAGFRCSFKLVSEGKFVLAKRKHASKIARSICDESRAAVVNAFAFTTAGPSGTHCVSPIALFANHAANDSISASAGHGS